MRSRYNSYSTYRALYTAVVRQGRRRSFDQPLSVDNATANPTAALRSKNTHAACRRACRFWIWFQPVRVETRVPLARHIEAAKTPSPPTLFPYRQSLRTAAAADYSVTNLPARQPSPITASIRLSVALKQPQPSPSPVSRMHLPAESRASQSTGKRERERERERQEEKKAQPFSARTSLMYRYTACAYVESIAEWTVMLVP